MSISSLAAADQLFVEFPDWRALSRTETAEDGTQYLVIEVTPPPQAMVEHGLVIDTSNEEVTVGFLGVLTDAAPLFPADRVGEGRAG